MKNFYGLVMAGGKGTRFWPESTIKRPKQYLKLLGPKTLLEEALLRFGDLIPKDRRYIVSILDQKDLAIAASLDCANSLGPIYEPEGRNTGPCILLSVATLEAQGLKETDVLAIVPSDHIILNGEGLRNTLIEAYKVASEKKGIVTIGIPPHFPNTGYGYIKKGAAIVGNSIFKVDQFREKPSYESAQEFVKSGEYFWNAGMFVAELGAIKNNFKQFAPEMFEFYAEILQKLKNKKSVSEIYSKLPRNSIDYAVMEKAQNVYVAKADFDWNDLGSWDAMENVLEKKEGNTFVTSNLSFVKKSKGNIIFAPGKFVSLIGVDNLIIVVNDKSIMVVEKAQAQEVKKIVEYLEKHPDENLKSELL